MSPDPSAHKRIDRRVRNIDSAAWDRETKCRHIWQLRQIHAEPRHETSHFEHGWPKPALWTQCGALVSGRMIPEPKAHASGKGKFCSVRRFLLFAKKFATLRPGWQTRPPLVGSVLPRGMMEYTSFRLSLTRVTNSYLLALGTPRRSRAR